MTRMALEERIDVAAGTVSRWILGQRTPTIDMALRIDKAVDFPITTWSNTHRKAA